VIVFDGAWLANAAPRAGDGHEKSDPQVAFGVQAALRPVSSAPRC
jgi:hypothetical protein